MIRDKLRARLVLVLAAIVRFLERKARDLQPDLTYVGQHHADEDQSTSERNVAAAKKARLAAVLGEPTQEVNLKFDRLIATEYRAKEAT